MSQEKIIGETPLSNHSFQAHLFTIAGDLEHLAKLYIHEPVWGIIHLEDDEERAGIMAREVSCNSVLAPGLDCLIEDVRTQNGEVDSAITMQRLDEGYFWDRKIMSGQYIPRYAIQAVAKQLIEFHFNQRLCPPASPEDPNYMPQFLNELMAIEFGILEREVMGYDRTWEGLMAAYILQNESVLNRRRELAGEPIVGHGDIKSDNIASSPDGQVYIIDPAPLLLWQINDRRMDAMFLRIGLEVMGRLEEADYFWDEYDKGYMQKVPDARLSSKETAEIMESNEVIDRISRIYRLIIFYRLAHKETDLPLERCKVLLVEAFGELAGIVR